MSLIAKDDKFAIFGARGMAGSAISRALQRSGYHHRSNQLARSLIYSIHWLSSIGLLRTSPRLWF